MAKRSLTRRNFFINVLKQQTLQYMNAETKELKKKFQKIVVNSKSIVSENLKYPFSQLRRRGVITYYYKGREAKENDSNFGKVVANQNSIVDRTLNIEKSIIDKYTPLIFAESQRLVPIDKRYAFVNSVKINSYRARNILDITGMENLSSVRNKNLVSRRLKDFRRLDEDRKAKDELANEGITVKNAVIRFSSGWYSGEQADFIRKYLSGTNRRGSYNLYYDSSTDTIYKRNSRTSLNFTPVTGISLNMVGKKEKEKDNVINTKYQPTGGYQELKSGGTIKNTANGYIIAYSAFDRTKQVGDRYNYAALQHDNLAFKHKYGESMYLSKAVMKYRQKIYEEHRKRVVKSITGG